MPDPIDIAVGERLRRYRRAAKLSQETLADALGLTFQQVQKYERGSNRISASMLVKAAQTVGCSVGDLVGETPGPALDPLTVELLAAFAALPGDRARRAVVEVCKAMKSG